MQKHEATPQETDQPKPRDEAPPSPAPEDVELTDDDLDDVAGGWQPPSEPTPW